MLSYWQNRRAEKQAEKRRAEERKASYNAKIKRLKSYKSKVETYKENLTDEKNNYYNLSDTESIAYKWIGENYNDIWGKINGDFDTSILQLIKDSDKLLDSVCDEITRLENKVNDEVWLIGNIKSSLNSIGNEIEKWLN